jgi:hypothetical protein
VFYFVGLDLGQAQDYTALAVVEQQLWTVADVDWADFEVFFPEGVSPGGWVSPFVVGPLYAERILAVNAHYRKGPLAANSPLFVRHLERYQLGTKYPEIVASVRSLLHREPFRGRIQRTSLLADKTGVGAAVVDSFYEQGVYPISVTIHGGSAVTYEARGFRVPKRDLVASVQTLLQNGRLKIAPEMELAPVLERELLNFKVKINPATAHNSYEHWREAEHDDLVLAVALACWHQEFTRKRVLQEIMW